LRGGGVDMEERRQDVEIRAGFEGHDRRIRSRRRNPNDAPPWSLDTKFRVLGRKHPRLDGPEKVTGTALYPSDWRPEGLCHAVILRSPIPRGTVAALDTAKAEALSGVKAVAIATRPGRKIRYQGQEICAIAAVDRGTAEDALALVEVRYEKDPDFTVLPEEDARKEISGIDPEPRDLAETGDQGKEEIELTLSFETQVQMHHPLEAHGVTVRPTGDGGLEVWASTQGTFMMQRSLAQAMRLPPNKVRVRTPHMGGGFGSKLTAGVEARLCAELAMKARAPVRLFVDRRGEALAVGNRPSSLHRIRARADRKGEILDWEARSFGFPGFAGSGRVAYPTFYRGVRPPRHRDILGNTGAGRAFRAPGHPQGFFAAESMIDELAYRLGFDPLDFRKRNVDEIYAWQIEIGAKNFDWKGRFNRAPGRRVDPDGRLRGVGLALTRWGGLGSSRGRVLCRIHPDGRVEVRNGAQDIGTGTRTVLALVVAETLGIDPSLVRCEIGDTRDGIGPGSGGSQTAATLAPAARHAAWLAGRELLDRVAEEMGTGPGKVALDAGKVTLPGGTALSWKAACAKIGAEPIEAMGQRYRNWRGYSRGVRGVQFAAVAVEPGTGKVKVERVVAVQDCGKVVDRLTAESQVIGGVIQGIGFGLYEERVVDPKLGRVLTTDFETYRIPGALEMPEITPILLDGCNGHSNTGVAGIGEPPTIPTSAAIANAVRNATGVRMRALPMTPRRVFEALSRMRGGVQ